MSKSATTINSEYWSVPLISKIPAKFYKEANEDQNIVFYADKIIFPENFIIDGVIKTRFTKTDGKIVTKYGQKYGNINDKYRIIMLNFNSYINCPFCISDTFFEEIYEKASEYTRIAPYHIKGKFLVKDHQLWIP